MVLTATFPHAIVACMWRCARVVEGADCKSAHVGSIPTSVSGVSPVARESVATLVDVALTVFFSVLLLRVFA